MEPSRGRINVLVWNFALKTPSEADVVLQFNGLKANWKIWQITLDAATASNDGNHRYWRRPITDLSSEPRKLDLRLAPYEVSLITLQKQDH